MYKNNALTQLLALLGTILACFPLLAPVMFSVFLLINDGLFLFDYLMPAELFPLALLGGALLVWAARRAHIRVRLIGGALVVAIVLLVVTTLLAALTGLASGRTAAAGWPLALMQVMLAAYTLALGVVAAGGILLLRDLVWKGGLHAKHEPS